MRNKEMWKRIDALVNYDKERLIQQGREEVMGPSEHVQALAHDSKCELTVTWLLKETLVKLIRSASRPCYKTVGDDGMRVIGGVWAFADEENYLQAEKLRDEISQLCFPKRP